MKKQKTENMKKLIMFMCVVGLTITATTKSFAQCEGVIIHAGASENIDNDGIHPARVYVAADYWKGIGFIGLTAEFPSKADNRYSVDLRGGFHFAGYYLGCSPYGKIGYNNYREVQPSSEYLVGYGVLFNVRFLESFGIFFDVNREHPVNFDNSIAFQKCKHTTIAFGLSIFIF